MSRSFGGYLWGSDTASGGGGGGGGTPGVTPALIRYATHTPAPATAYNPGITVLQSVVPTAGYDTLTLAEAYIPGMVGNVQPGIRLFFDDGSHVDPLFNNRADAANFSRETVLLAFNDKAIVKIEWLAKNIDVAPDTQSIGQFIWNGDQFGGADTLRTDLADTANGKGASLVSIEDAATLYTATDVEAALAEVKLIANAASVATDLASTANAKGASLVGIEDSGTLYTATTVEGALAEVRTVANTPQIHKQSINIDFAPAGDNFAALGAGVKTFAKNLGAALPVNGRLFVVVMGENFSTVFDDAAHGTYTLETGTAGDVDAIGTAINVAAGTIITFPATPIDSHPGILGFPMYSFSGVQTQVKLTSSVDLNTVTQGKLSVDLYYIILA